MEVNEALLEASTHNVEQSNASVRDAKQSLAKTHPCADERPHNEAGRRTG